MGGLVQRLGGGWAVIQGQGCDQEVPSSPRGTFPLEHPFMPPPGGGAFYRQVVVWREGSVHAVRVCVLIGLV